MSKQLNLLDYKPETIQPVDPNVQPKDKPRLGKSSLRILARLKEGPATNAELMQIGGMRFGARLHDLKKAGHKFKSANLDGGLWIYELEEQE